MQKAIFCGSIAGILCGLIGSFVVIRKLSFISGSISHAVISGVGISLYFKLPMNICIIVASQFFAILIGWISKNCKYLEQSLIAAVWAGGMAIGILFAAITKGYSYDLLSYLFGNILIISRDNVMMTCVLTVIILLYLVIMYRELVYTCFDEEYTQISGKNTNAIFISLLCAIALTVVVMMQIVGVLLAMTLLTLPATIMFNHTSKLKYIMSGAALINVIMINSGLILSYYLNLAVGPLTVVLITILFLLDSIIFRKK